jgi:hypothetical protein
LPVAVMMAIAGLNDRLQVSSDDLLGGETEELDGGIVPVEYPVVTVRGDRCAGCVGDDGRYIGKGDRHLGGRGSASTTGRHGMDVVRRGLSALR